MPVFPTEFCNKMQGSGPNIRSGKMKRRVVHFKGQSLIEYALVIAVVGMAASAMSVYVYRAVQAQQKTVSDEYQKD